MPATLDPPTVTDPAPAARPEPALTPRAAGGLTTPQKVSLVVVPIVLAVLAWGGGLAFYDRVGASPPAPAPAKGEPDGAKLFARYCAFCHGGQGKGAGRAVHCRNPPARRVWEERFKLVTTANGVPTDDDLMSVFRHGIPGTAMPPFAELSDAELRAVVGHVRRLTAAGL